MSVIRYHVFIGVIVLLGIAEYASVTAAEDRHRTRISSCIDLLKSFEKDDADRLRSELFALSDQLRSRSPEASIVDITDERFSDVKLALDQMFKTLVMKASWIWEDKHIDYMRFFLVWMQLAHRVNLLGSAFHWFPYRALENYKKICVKQFQTLQTTTELVSNMKFLDPTQRVSTPENPIPWEELVIIFPLQSIWLDLAQDAMAKYTAVEGKDPDGVVQDILKTARKLRSRMPKAIPRPHLYQLTETEQQAYREAISDETCAICLERAGSKLGERIHCEYVCGKAFHTNCILDYVRKTKKGLPAVCAYRCPWPVLIVPRKMPGLRQSLQATWLYFLAMFGFRNTNENPSR